jgi:glucose-6-phosphate 1-dehydrogenase
MKTKIGTLVIFGASGDLTERLLLPGLGQLIDAGEASDLQVIGVGRSPLSNAMWRERVAKSFSAGGSGSEASRSVAQRAEYRSAEVTNPDDLKTILAACTGTPALYFAVPPRVTIAAVAALAKVELPKGIVLGLEKPFGTDLRSAERLNRQLIELVPEQQIHRVDHFLGKSTVLNLLGLRFANRILEPVWNADNIASVEIVFDEQLGLEGRAGYYDTAGALVDMIQSHLLLVMAVVAMEPPSSVDAEDLRGAMAQALRATRIYGGDPIASSRRARYTAGTVNGRKLPAYVKESGVDPANQTETLAEVTLGINNWRWAGVPFTLRSGKAMAEQRKEIVVTFKDAPHVPDGMSGTPGPAALRIALTPEAIRLDLNINGQGSPFGLDRVVLGTEFAPGDLGPYGEVLSGMLSSDPTLSVRADEIEQCWRIVEPVLAAWRKDAVPMQNYSAGSSGPKSWQGTR